MPVGGLSFVARIRACLWVSLFFSLCLCSRLRPACLRAFARRALSASPCPRLVRAHALQERHNFSNQFIPQISF
ncbi:hypothetical protein BJV74DRAFT_874472 [Russula compacta]|nr:hypothetical protein BJV74DRAFT_874472 [Russula compacta]